MAAGFGDNDAAQAPAEISAQDKQGNPVNMMPSKADHLVVKAFQQL